MHLRHITSEREAILLFDLEHYHRWFEVFSLSAEKATDVALVNTIYMLLSRIIVGETTGISVSPQFGWDVLHSKPAQTGVVFPLEQTMPETDPLSLPVMSPQWTVEHIRNNYGIAKLELHYHPDEPVSIQKRKLVAELYEYTQYEQIDFILDLKVKTHTDRVKSNEDFQNVQLTAIKHFRQLCDCFILEAPQDALSTATVTAELDVPWIVAEQAKTYEEHKEIVRLMIENGAKGCLVGPLICSGLEIGSLHQDDIIKKLEKELLTTVRDRVLELRRIVEEGQI